MFDSRVSCKPLDKARLFYFLQRSAKLLEEASSDAAAMHEEMSDARSALTSARQQLTAAREDHACSEAKVCLHRSISFPSSPCLNAEHL